MNKVIYASFVAAGALAVAAGSPVLAQESGTNHARASLNGFQENPSIVTTGTGTFDLSIDDAQQTITFQLMYSGLEGLEGGGTVSAAHIHIGSRATNGGVSAFLCGGSTKPLPCPQQGTVTGTIMPADVIGPTVQGIGPGEFEKLVRAIRAGHTYVNVHTTRWPGGEIRGQINNDTQRQFEQ